ncbi:MAG: AAA domain-containing protein [Nonomuraea sp.]|nr:AAA domain-containing protein [Nonomuraea sp.]
MSTTVIEPTTAQGAVINQDINARVRAIMDEMNQDLKERTQVIHGAWVGRIAQLHLVMRGPGGTGKSMLQRTMVEHIRGSVPFETAFDETTDPSKVFGPPDIKAMAEDGRTRTVTTGMLSEATDAFLDEFFNGNIPLLHSIMPVLNERLFHDDGKAIKTPLRQCIMGTNKLNLDPDLAALFDRVHLRYEVGYLSNRENLRDMVIMSVARLASKGRGAATNTTTPTTVTLEELDQAFAESLALSVPDAILDLFIDLREELKGNGINFSDRRFNDGMNAALANAWLRNHAEVQSGDLDILANMWWTTEEQMSTARGIILSAASPGEKKALDLLDALDDLKAEMRKVEGDDDERKRRVGVEQVRNAEKLVKEAEAELEAAKAAGQSTGRLEEVIARADSFKVEVAREVFGISTADVKRTAGV